MAENKYDIEHNQKDQTKIGEHETTRILQDDQILQKLGQKIDRRLNIGYYCQVPTNRRSLIFPVRKKIPVKPKRQHPIILKRKKKEKQPLMVDMEQNTDDVPLTDDFQNTSKEFVLKEADPIVQDNEMQWSCQTTVIQQKNQSLQWSIEPIDQQVQYSLEEDVIQCRDASIQYDIEQQPQPLLEKNQVINRATQSLLIQQQSHGIQFDEVKPILKSENIQIDIPDQQQIKNMSLLEQKVKKLSKEHRRQVRINKIAKQQQQISVLKEDVLKLQGAVSLKQQRDKYLLKILGKQKQLQEMQKLHLSEKTKISDKMKRQYNKNLLDLVSKLQINKKRDPMTNSNVVKESKLEIQQLDKQKQDLLNYRKEACQLTEEIKSQMLKRLKFQQDEKEQQLIRNSNVNFEQNRDLRNRQLKYSSMQKLFPRVSVIKKCFAGTIVKNIINPEQREQKKFNSHFESAKLTKAYWREKSSFSYEYNNDHMNRSMRKSKFFIKINDNISMQQLNDCQQKKNQTFSLNKIQSRNKMSLLNNAQKINRYKFNKGMGSSSELFQTKGKIDAFFENQMYFKFIYNQYDKINVGYSLFLIFGVSIQDKNNIQILRFPKHTVFTHFNNGETNFIVISTTLKQMLYSRAQLQEKLPYTFYQSQISYKNFWVYQYLGPKDIYVGQCRSGKRHGYGLWYTGANYFEGQFVLGYKQGRGKLSLQNGDIYEGQFQNNVFKGSGIYKWVNGQVYDGYFSQGKKHGFGKQCYANGDVYEGYFIYNKKEGNGVYKWKDGAFFEGQYKEDLKWGQGKLTTVDGKCIFGRWKRDQLIEDWNMQRSTTKINGELPLLKRKRIGGI